MKPAILRPRALRGQSLLMFALALTAIVALVGLAVDASGAYRARARLTATCELAKDSSLNSLNVVKFSDDPAAASLELVAAALAADGFQGEFELIYFELPADDTGSADRVAGVRVELGQSYRTLVAAVAGVDEIEVRAALSWSVNPYSSSIVWRPDDATSRRYRGAVGDDGSLTIESTEELSRSALQTLPRDLVEAIREAQSSVDAN